MTPSFDAPKVYEISDIEEKYCCTSMQTFIGDFPLNSVQNLPVIASKTKEKFDFSPSNVVSGMHICKKLDILEEISYYKSDTFSPHDLDLQQIPA